MPVLKLLVNKSFKEKEFFEKIAKRGEVSDMVKNPFTTKMKLISKGKELLVLFDIEPLYPSIIPKAGLFLGLVGLLFGWKITMFLGLGLSLTFFFWTDRFFFLILKKARKKQGLKEDIKLLSSSKAFKKVIEWDK